MSRIIKNLSYLLVTFCVMFMSALVAAFASSPVKTVANYKVSSMGFDIGDAITTQRMTEEKGAARIHFETKTLVNASFLWMEYHLELLEKGMLLNGDLVSYYRKGLENAVPVDIEGHLENSTFRFDVREHGVTRTVLIPRNSYDYTTMECPEARLNFTGKTQVALKILDVEKMAVVKRDYHLIRTAHYTVAGKEHPCRIVDFSDQNKNARRWITWDGSAAVMYRQDSKGGKNSYSVQATSVTKEM